MNNLQSYFYKDIDRTGHSFAWYIICMMTLFKDGILETIGDRILRNRVKILIRFGRQYCQSSYFALVKSTSKYRAGLFASLYAFSLTRSVLKAHMTEIQLTFVKILHL